MTGVEQVIERIEDTTPPSVSPVPSTPAQVDGRGAAGTDPQGSQGGFSPDPARRTDRYRLVTPYCLRL